MPHIQPIHQNAAPQDREIVGPKRKNAQAIPAAMPPMPMIHASTSDGPALVAIARTIRCVACPIMTSFQHPLRTE